MKVIAVLALLPLAFALPNGGGNGGGNFNVCEGLPGTPECCAVNVLGVADLNCAPPPRTPTSVQDFKNQCAAIGQQAQCCTLPLLGQGLICQSPP